MGGSRRRLKKSAPKVKVGVVKTRKNQKAKLPQDVTQRNRSVEERLHLRVSWEEEHTLTSNYEANKFVADPNEGFGRNQRSAPLVPKEAREQQGEETFSDDDEMRVACSHERRSGKAPPKRPTSHQVAVVRALIAAHGDDVRAMFRDIKLNRMQHSEGRLRELLEAYHHWGAEGSQRKHDFRGPQKPYKRL